MKKPDLETVILSFIVGCIMVVVYLLLAGCTSAKMSDTKVLWHDGNCMLYVSGISVTRAKELKKNWNFSDCEVIVEENEGVKK